MLLESERLGPVEVDEANRLELREGLLGFESLHEYALLPADDTGAYMWFHSLDDPALAFLAVVPGLFFPDYEPDVPTGDVIALGIETPEDADLFCLVTIGDEAITANLLGPVVFNIHTRIGRQVVLVDQGWTTKEPLVAD